MGILAFGSKTKAMMGLGTLVAAGVVGGLLLWDPGSPPADEEMAAGSTEAGPNAGSTEAGPNAGSAEAPAARVAVAATQAGGQPGVAGCPEDMMDIAVRQGGLEACGTGRQPLRSLPLDGIWEIESPGNPKIDALTLFMHSNYGPLHRGVSSLPSPAHAVWRLKGEGHYRPRAFPIRVHLDDDGAVRMSAGQFEYCNCVTVNWRVSPTADPDVMIGEWSYNDEAEGVSIWRRRSSAAVVESVSIWSGTYDAAEGWQPDVFAYGARPGRLQRQHPVAWGNAGNCDVREIGNCRKVFVSVYGEEFEGAHDIWIDPATHIEIDEARWICTNGETQHYGWYDCGIGDFPGEKVAGIQIKLDLNDGATSRALSLWIDGQPIPIDFRINDQPEEDAAPALVMLDAVNTAGEQITQVDEGMPFHVKAIYDAPHPEDWVSLALPDLSRELVLFRTQDPRVFQSDWVAVAEDER